KNAEQRSVLEDANVLAVRKTLATSDKILINGEADSFLEKMGVFNGKTSTTEGGGLFCKAFDGMTDSTRQTGSTNHTVTNAELSMLACTTGCRFSENLQKFLPKTGFEGMFNRILYYVSKKRNAVRSQDKRPDLKMHHQPSLTPIFLGVHHFGDCTTKRKSNVLATSTSSNKPSSSSLLNLDGAQGQRLKKQMKLSSRQLSPEAKVLLMPYNIFGRSSLSHGTAGNGVLYPMQKICIAAVMGKLKTAGLVIDGHFVYTLDKKRKLMSYIKMKAPTMDPEREEFAKKLESHGVSLTEYEDLYHQSSIPGANTLSPVAVTYMTTHREYVSEYHKYENHEQMSLALGEMINSGDIAKQLVLDPVTNELVNIFVIINESDRLNGGSASSSSKSSPTTTNQQTTANGDTDAQLLKFFLSNGQDRAPIAKQTSGEEGKHTKRLPLAPIDPNSVTNVSGDCLRQEKMVDVSVSEPEDNDVRIEEPHPLANMKETTKPVLMSSNNLVTGQDNMYIDDENILERQREVGEIPLMQISAEEAHALTCHQANGNGSDARVSQMSIDTNSNAKTLNPQQTAISSKLQHDLEIRPITVQVVSGLSRASTIVSKNTDTSDQMESSSGDNRMNNILPGQVEALEPVKL
ncbi:unnamed protein product, partial [Didymodactylos carnosus]